MVTWAWIVACVFVGLWLLTWAVQLAAYAMFALGWVLWTALRIVVGVAGLLLAGWLAVFGSPDEKLLMRRTWREGRARAGGGFMRPA